MVEGPFETLDVGGGVTADYYLLRFDKDGQLASPRTEQVLKAGLEGVSDVYLFSHGWNNTFADAAARYKGFIEGYMAQRASFGLPFPEKYKPMLIGVIWPSTSFLMPWEEGPHIAADGDAQEKEMRTLVGESLDPGADAELAALIDGRETLSPEEARRAAELVLAALRSDVDPDDGSSPPKVAELLDAWAALDGRAAAKPSDPDDFRSVSAQPAPGGSPAAAGVLGLLDPRNLLRMGTVWTMKDRAGKVGAHGVGPLVRHVLDHTSARLHLVGHSFGARVVLSALAAGPQPTRQARSMLLLQPAINRWCFAGNVVDSGRAGGYHPILTRVELPVLTTFSRHDKPLHEAFHLAVRGNSLGEPRIAAVGDTFRFGALGGYGPEGLGPSADTQKAIAANRGRYDFGDGVRVVAVDGGVDLDGGPAIGGHGDISNSRTWWALHCLTGPG